MEKHIKILEGLKTNINKIMIIYYENAFGCSQS
jgi:hypothetical protein